ncbi:hypothetical protein Lal_00013330 [Lupinus albus]|nr:hypothetical protein Lal_00013330 [Lupinus albus]
MWDKTGALGVEKSWHSSNGLSPPQITNSSLMQTKKLSIFTPNGLIKLNIDESCLGNGVELVLRSSLSV